jgi:hypothetical protein
MPIQTIVASLTLIHLRDEITSLKKELSRIEIKINELKNYGAEHRAYLNISEYMRIYETVKMMRDQSIKAYNNILIILREDSGEDMSEYKYLPEDHVYPVDMSIRG